MARLQCSQCLGGVRVRSRSGCCAISHRMYHKFGQRAARWWLSKQTRGGMQAAPGLTGAACSVAEFSAGLSVFLGTGEAGLNAPQHAHVANAEVLRCRTSCTR